MLYTHVYILDLFAGMNFDDTEVADEKFSIVGALVDCTLLLVVLEFQIS